MKSTIFLLAALTLIFFGESASAQKTNECKVMISRIQGNYNGGCKKGLAHGKGTAKGTDKYEGKFKAGYPEGNGKYTYSDGASYDGDWKKGKRDGYGKYVFKENQKDSIQEGLWENDVFTFKTKPVAKYKVSVKRNVDRYRFVEIGTKENKISIRFLRAGSNVPISNLMLHGSSGNIVKQGNYNGFENVTYPFTGKVQYSVPSKLNPQLLRAEFSFVVNKEGQWEVQLQH